jgi:CRP-like cAMP-binding protein
MLPNACTLDRYGDLLPVTTFERLYTMIVMIGGVTFFAMITGTLTDIISSSSRSEQRFREFMHEVDEFSQMAHVPEDQMKLMLQFLELKYPDRSIFNDSEIIQLIPTGLRRQILSATYGDMVIKVPLFQKLKEATVQQVCGSIRIVHCIPHDNITTEGKDPDACYIIRYGSVLLSRMKMAIQEIGPGHMFGELAMFGFTTDGLRYRSAVSMSQCELMQFTREDIMNTMLENFDLKRRFRSLAAIHITKMCESAELVGEVLHGDALIRFMSRWQFSGTDTTPSHLHMKAVFEGGLKWQQGDAADDGVGKEATPSSQTNVQCRREGDKEDADGAYTEMGGDMDKALIVHVVEVKGLPMLAPEHSECQFRLRAEWVRAQTDRQDRQE